VLAPHHARHADIDIRLIILLQHYGRL
jgi:hypothetical protein